MEEIVNQATKTKADLIGMGSHGKSAHKDAQGYVISSQNVTFSRECLKRNCKRQGAKCKGGKRH